MELQTNPHNPRTISKDAYEKLKRSIERNPDGLTANKIAYKDGIIISGNQRYRAILELGLTIKPEWLKDLSGWTQEQIDEWVIQSNISAGEWDWDILANEWEADNLIDWGIDMPDDWGTTKELPEDIDEIPEVKTPVSKLGDLWLLGNHRVLCGDSTDQETVELLMDGQKADMVFTDPPYRYKDFGEGGAFNHGTKLKNDLKGLTDFDPSKFLQLLKTISGKTINAYIFCNTALVPDYCIWAKENGFNFNILTWHKKQFVPATQNHHFPDTEYLIYISKSAIFNTGLDVNYGKYWVLDNEKHSDHPTIKPVEIIIDEIKISK